MSQVSPSVSHQLAAASIAFRRARKKFPKDFGVRSKDVNTEVASARRDRNDQQPVSSSSVKCMSSNDKPHCFCSKSACSDDGPRYLSGRQSSSIRQSKCACRRRKEESFEETTRWSNDRSALGDVLDKSPTREDTFTDDFDPKKSIDPYDKEREKRKCTCCPSKLDSVDLLYVAPNEKHSHLRSIDDHGYPYVEDEARHNFSRRNPDDQELLGSCSKLDRSLVKREERISPLLRTCDPRSPRDINLDLLRSSPEDHRPRPCHRYPSCSRYSCQRRCCYCCQQKSERISNFLPVGCTCPSIPDNRRGCSWKNHERTRPCGRKKKDEEEVLVVKDVEEGEEDENVGVIDHKDSIAILMEKYKSRNTRNEHFEKGRKDRSETEKKDDRIDDPRCENASEVRNSRFRYRCRCQENRRRWEEGEKERTLLLDDGRNRIRGEGDFYRRKEHARSRFEAPWRHTV